jgi:2-methylisocitrate lyase-like PEP mutase family enzyme
MSFRALHVPGDPLVMPNPWDVGSAVMLQSLGAKALGSTSAGAAFSLGQCDGTLDLAQKLANAVAINDATNVPVSADLENGGGDSAESAADAIRAAAGASLAGASIEDLGKDPADPIYPFNLALARIEAAVDAARDTGVLLTARSEGLLTGTLTLTQVAARIRAFAQAGADVVFAPGLKTSEEVKTIMEAAKDTPVSVLIGSNQTDLTVANLANLGVARISFGSGLARLAYGAVIAMMRDALAGGAVDYPNATASFQEIETLLER